MWCIGNNMSGVFGVGFAKNFNGPKELSFFKDNLIELQDLKCTKYGECYFLTQTGKVYRTGGTSDFYVPRLILNEHVISSIDEEGIFKTCKYYNRH